jgi:hypothetical protein
MGTSASTIASDNPNGPPNGLSPSNLPITSLVPHSAGSAPSILNVPSTMHPATSTTIIAPSNSPLSILSNASYMTANSQQYQSQTYPILQRYPQASSDDLTDEETDKYSSGQRSIPADGYKWRKYGQKTVKGSKYPRNYYKCTFPGCVVKKYVEQVEENGRVIDKVTYRGGEHTHDAGRVTRVNVTDQSAFKSQVLTPEGVISTDVRIPSTVRIILWYYAYKYLAK